MNSVTDHIALGTVQLGVDYGIANTTGKPTKDEARAIIDRAYTLGIRYFDTAQAYGNSEEVLGAFLSEYSDLNIISKFAPDLDYLTPNVLSKSFDITIQKLRQKPWGMMLHRYTWMKDWKNGLKDTIKKVLIDEGVLFGVSVYSAAEADVLMAIDEVKIIQIPFNIFSKDMLSVLAKAKQTNKMLFLRSIYLQGLLLMDIAMLPREMSFAKEFLEDFHEFCVMKKLTIKEFCLGYVLFKVKEFGGLIVFGVETDVQLLENIELSITINIDGAIFSEWDAFLSNRIIPDIFLTPNLWPKRMPT